MVFCFYCYYFTPFYPKTQWANITNNGAECVDFAQGKLIHTILAATAAANCRDLKDNPTFAYASQRSASGFLSPPRHSGHTFHRTRGGFTLSACSSRCEEKKAKAWFCLREDLIHENSFELTKEFSVRKGETCRSPPYGGSAAVSPLCASSRQGAMAGGALRLPPCPLRLPLLFPKNLAALRFSGALFIFRAHLL